MKPVDHTGGACPYCGHVPGTSPGEDWHLHPGTVLKGRYLVGTAAGFGGFGITYRAWDQALDKQVAVKEFFPWGIACRAPGQARVAVGCESRADEFWDGRRRFLAEARNMARFGAHPNLVHVYEFFEENSTVYMVMEFLEGLSYQDYIMACGGRVDADAAVGVILPVLNALKALHDARIIHRDVNPDHIFLVPAEPGPNRYRVKLIDFGAARFPGEEERALPMAGRPGYVPPEQYRRRSRLGPWTDIYAAGAVLYRSVTGRIPEDSVSRMGEDHLVPPGDLVPELPRYLNDSILRAMAPDPRLRFRNAVQFREAIRKKKKVFSIDRARRQRSVICGIRMAAVCGVVLGAALCCLRIYEWKRQEIFGVTAFLTVQMPDLNRQKQAELAAAEGGRKTFVPEDSAAMLDRMMKEYGERFKRVRIAGRRILDASGYREELLGQAEGGSLPSVFESTGLGAADGHAWEQLGTLDLTYGALDPDLYYFMDRQEFQETFAAAKKQVPVSFSAPVLYVNTRLVSDLEKLDSLRFVTSLEELSGEDGQPDYCVGRAYRQMYREAFAVAAGTGEFEEGLHGEKGYEPFLKRERAYYLGSTDDYEAVRAGLGGIYQMVVPEVLWREKRLKGAFTHLWSIGAGLEREEDMAADCLVYYLMGEGAQDVLNLQCGSGLPLRKSMMEIYVEGNDEFDAVADNLRYLEMDYGDGPDRSDTAGKAPADLSGHRAAAALPDRQGPGLRRLWRHLFGPGSGDRAPGGCQGMPARQN